MNLVLVVSVHRCFSNRRLDSVYRGLQNCSPSQVSSDPLVADIVGRVECCSMDKLTSSWILFIGLYRRSPYRANAVQWEEDHRLDSVSSWLFRRANYSAGKFSRAVSSSLTRINIIFSTILLMQDNKLLYLVCRSLPA